MTSPTVQYQYANGASNSTRLTGVTYPNGRRLSYLYGSAGGADDAVGRVTGIVDTPGVTLADYEYLGLGTVARVDYPEPAIENVLAGGGTNPDTGDIYTGLDRFGRIIDCHWRKYSPSPTTDIERVQYTYDRVGNRLTRQNLVAATTSKTRPEATATTMKLAPMIASSVQRARSIKP